MSTRGSYKNGKLTFFSTSDRGHGTGFYEKCPTLAAISDPAAWIYDRDEFLHFDNTSTTGAYISSGSGATIGMGSNYALMDGGNLVLSTALTADVQANVRSSAPLILPTGKMWYGTTVSVTGVADTAFVIGLGDLTTGVIASGGLTMSSSLHGMAFIKLKGATSWSAGAFAGASTTLYENVAAYANGRIHFGFMFYPDDVFNYVVKEFYVNGVLVATHDSGESEFASPISPLWSVRSYGTEVANIYVQERTLIKTRAL